GLTKTYNRFHDPHEHDAEIALLRQHHAAMDRAVLDAYGWTDIPTGCEFLLDYGTDDEGWGSKKRPYRYRWPDVVRDEVLARLLESHEEGNEPSAVADYGHYFLGSIIVSEKDGQKFIIDGQQRLTTLTLLLIFLRHHIEDIEQKGQLADLIFSLSHRKRSFNLD